MKNKRTKIIIISVAVLLLAIFISIAGCSKNSGEEKGEKQLYTCGMHPNVIRDKPGLCPICNMNLVPVKSSGSSASSETPSGERKILYWTDPMMNPPYISEKPGKSPMGMDLVPVYEDQATGGNTVTIDPAIIQNIGVRFAKVTRGPLEKTIKAPAHVDYNEDHAAVLSTRSEGWIEKLYVKSPGTSVKKGTPLFEFYSPKLYSAQEEYRIALRTGDKTLAAAARERLNLLGISGGEISSIGSKGSRRTLTIAAPIDGIVVSIGSSSSGGASQSSQSSSGGMSSMGGSGGGTGSSTTPMPSSSGATIREGDFVSSGTSVFTIADLSTLWVYAHIFEEDLPYVKVGLKATLELDYLRDTKFEGTVDFIYPFLDKQTRDIKVRSTFPNEDGKLMPEMYGKMLIESKISDDALMIPMEAVLHSGDRRIVFISLEGGRFLPQDVQLGPTDGKGNVQILSGLYEGQTVVTSAQFLIDSESHLKEALEKMMAGTSGKAQSETVEKPAEPEKSPQAQPEQAKPEEKPMKKTEEKPVADSNKQKESEVKEPVKKEQESKPAEKWPNLAPDDPKAKWGCPMPEDRYYAAEPGDCPVCGMHLVPHDPVEWAKTHKK